MKELYKEYIEHLDKLIKEKAPVFKTQCQITFKDVFSEEGLFLNLKTMEAYSKDYLEWDHIITGCRLYFNIVGKKKYNVEKVENPRNISIGKEGGYFPERSIFEEFFIYKLMELPNKKEIELEDPEIPEDLIDKLRYIIQYDSNNILNKGGDLLVPWSEERKISRHAENLLQISSSKQIASSGWVCEKCGSSKNLWLNLSDGFIGCGRRLYGIGGGCFNGSEEGAALLHYKEYNDRPLVVKLGTITQFGTADVFSYDPEEDDLVIDPYLTKHLSNFGINIDILEKTEKNLTELQIEQNNKLDWSNNDELEDFCMVQCRKLENNKVFVGLENIGNSCYINVILQFLAYIPEIEDLFINYFDLILNVYSKHFNKRSRIRDNIVIQFARVIRALVTDDIYIDRKYKIDKSIDDIEEAKSRLKNKNINSEIIESLFRNDLNYEYVNILPIVFKRAVALGNMEFSSSHQQDTQEYFSFFIEKLSENLKEYRRYMKKEVQDLIDRCLNLFSFFHIERLECKRTNRIKYITEINNVLSLSIPQNMDTRAELDSRQFKKQRQDHQENNNDFSLNLVSLLNNWNNEEIVENFLSPCTNTLGKAGKINYLKTMPKYLIIHMKRFFLSEDWKPMKINCRINVPDFLNIEHLRGSDKYDGNEVPFPDEDDSEKINSKIDIPDSLLKSILDLGFSNIHAELAIRNTGTTDPELCINWILTNVSNNSIDSEDFSSNFNSTQKCDKEIENNVDNVVSICCCSKDIAIKALKISNNNIENAIQIIFDDPSIIESFQENDIENRSEKIEKSELSEFDDGPGNYELIGIINHIGNSVYSGHYVCYLKKEIELDNKECKQFKWIKFNDTKIHICKDDNFPQREYGYLYIYRRMNS